MSNSFQTPLALIGRIMLALMFVLAGISKIGGFAGTAGYIGSKGLPMPDVLAALTILLEIGGGLALVFGLFTRWAAIALALFTLLASVIFHNFWAVPEAQQMTQQLMFMKNISVAGGLFVLAAFGAGALSLDAKRGR
ncbi:MAG: DoxX family protein [Burkholderiaceae bacterium]